MNRMGPVVLVLATANALIAAAMAGAFAAVAVFLALLAAGFLAFRLRRAPAEADAPPAGPVGAEAVAIGGDGAQLIVRLGMRDWPARPAPGAAPPRYGDRVRVLAVEDGVLVVRLLS